MKKTFRTIDQVLPDLKFPGPVLVEIKIREDFIYLYVGPRDWQWDLKTGNLVGSGTALISGEEED